MMMGVNTARKTALADISKHIREEYDIIMDGNRDVWVVTPAHLFTKEVRRLNKKLNIHKINKQWKKIIS